MYKSRLFDKDHMFSNYVLWGFKIVKIEKTICLFTNCDKFFNCFEAKLQCRVFSQIKDEFLLSFLTISDK